MSINSVVIATELTIELNLLMSLVARSISAAKGDGQLVATLDLYNMHQDKDNTAPSWHGWSYLTSAHVKNMVLSRLVSLANTVIESCHYTTHAC